MSRRRVGAGNISLSALTAYLLLSSLAFASPQQEQKLHRRSRPEDGDAQHQRFSSPPSPPSRPILHDAVLDSVEYRHLKDTSIDSNRASAIATLAPAISNAVRAPHPAQQRESGKHAGLSSLLNARSLRDWEVEDFILLATVDGSIHARDRNTGAPRWALEVDKPMVETVYHRQNRSHNPEDHRPEDELLWIVEPSRDGDIYVYNQYQKGGLHRLRLTVKKLAEELSPYAGEDPAVVYTAEKKTTLFTVDAATGTITKMFSSRGSTLNDDRSCKRINGLEGRENDECGSSGSIVLGRTEYTVGIQHRDTAEPICTLMYSEWGPNNRDSDLHSQYSATMDQKYVYSRHDGSIFGFDHAKADERRKAYTQKLPSPVVRVFDIARPMDTEEEDVGRDTQLVILPQPVGPIDNENVYNSEEDRNRIFVNHTEAGGWFAMSETSYPLVTGGAAKAQCYNEDWLEMNFPTRTLTTQQMQKALIGVHSLSDRPAEGNRFMSISGPTKDNINDTPVPVDPQSPPMSSNFVLKNSKIIRSATANALDFVITIILTIVLTFVIINHKSLTRILRHNLELKRVFPEIDKGIASPPTSPILAQAPRLPQFEPTSTGSTDDRSDRSDDQSTPTLSRRGTIENGEARVRTASFAELEGRGRSKSNAHVRVVEPSPSPSVGPRGDEDGTETPTPNKKKARRGCRGGNKHKKKKASQLRVEDSEAVHEAVQEALHIAEEPQVLEPDVEIVNVAPNTNVADVSGPLIQIGHLKVQTDAVLGYGSQGTVVYKGSFGGRDVAVKRMLQEFYDIASHEVGLLQESDDHPNVIRYYDKESAGEFLYIALELCPASLQEVVEKPTSYSELLGVTGIDPPDVLKQITAGLRYLHSLKIIHRDIKPQNILVSAPKKLPAKPNIFQPPRLLISDFGLCKKLEGDQSSFRATTAHAAGTSGWRAPELLVDDDAVANPNTNSVASNASSTTTMRAASTTSTNSEPLVLDTQTNRRATRAIDIFSLGCVFYYVLTSGSHPFDRDGKYMREANIVKGHYSLAELDRLGDYQWEAKDLVARMLSLDPKARPDATAVLAHPFFWTPAQRLDFLCQVSDAFEFEPRDPPSAALATLEAAAPALLEHCGQDFLRVLPAAFRDTLGKQRKYSGHRLLDLLRALRNKKNHYEDMPEAVKEKVGRLPEGYLGFWTRRFPGLLMACHAVVFECGWEGRDRFAGFYNVE